MRIDLHQHLLPEDLLAALARRTGSPRIVREGRGWSLRLAGEPACTLDLSDHDPAARARLAERDELDRVVLSISCPLGIEALPAEEAEPLLAAYNRGVLELGGPFAAWGAVGLEGATPAAVDALLDAGAVGVTLPAGAVVDHRGWARSRRYSTGSRRAARRCSCTRARRPGSSPTPPSRRRPAGGRR